MSNAVRTTALRAGGACVRCRKGKTKCVYENGRAPCKNCAKGMHECYLPSESMAHHHGQSPARHTASHRPARESLPAAGGSSGDSRAVSSSAPSRHAPATGDKYITPELLAECERVVSKTFPACVAFHKPSFIQQLKNGTMSPSLVFGLLTAGARSSPALIRRYGNQGAGTPAAEHFATKAIDLINQNMDAPTLPDIQAMCLLIIHEWGTRNAVRAYIYLGMAARMVQMYRILNSHHQQSDSPDKFLQDESFRRTVWLLYILDSMLVSTPGRHPALTPDDVSDVSLPCTDINFAFGNPVYVKTLSGADPSWVKALTGSTEQAGEIGEFGHIVMATRIWRDTVSLLTTTTPETFRDELCEQLTEDIEHLRSILPMQFVNKPGQINLHITMGTGFTYAFLHTLLYCSHIFLYRRRLLHAVTQHDFDLDAFRSTRTCQELIDQLFTSSHSTLAMLNAIETGADTDSKLCMPIFMLFAAFTASATVAYLSLKGLTPPNVVETAGHIVRDGLHFTAQGAESWPLTISWNRHIAVMHRVLMSEGNQAVVASLEVQSKATPAPPSVKDMDAGSNPDTSDVMDYDQQSNPPGNQSQDGGARGESAGGGEDARGESEPPLPLPRRPGGIATINGGSGGVSTPATVSPPPPHEVKNSPRESVDDNMAAVGAAPTRNGVGMGTPAPSASDRVTQSGGSSSDMTPAELCIAFERQLLELDDLAAFMGGGV